MIILKTVTYESKLLEFQNGQALFLKFYYQAHLKTGRFLAETIYISGLHIISLLLRKSNSHRSKAGGPNDPTTLFEKP
ncbi:hypothetical protein L21SP5_00614 [Salinivirga cyanobacteriivorans]|uniref:Uncharacterized protein n=1 Tax=Salinivirga cyanobacteriivorans TaxID=1307839 RepID=A0A0S2HW47_9BACT|nr:hypothetical protein L21SP5_00614 [Salinivirga cyanobacteriivorans]